VKLLDFIRKEIQTDRQVVHVHNVPARMAQYADLSAAIDPRITAVLKAMGVERLYSHQVAAIENILAGKNAAICTGTASGKTLCYTVPIINELLRDATATALLIYPTKALSRDQLRIIHRFREIDPSIEFQAGAYDGDTPEDLRRKLP